MPGLLSNFQSEILRAEFWIALYSQAEAVGFDSIGDDRMGCLLSQPWACSIAPCGHSTSDYAPRPTALHHGIGKFFANTFGEAGLGLLTWKKKAPISWHGASIG